MLSKQWVLLQVFLLALLSILLLPSIAMAQVIGLTVVHDDGKRVGPEVDINANGNGAALVYYLGNPSEAAYFQFKNYAFLEIKPDGMARPQRLFLNVLFRPGILSPNPARCYC